MNEKNLSHARRASDFRQLVDNGASIAVAIEDAVRELALKMERVHGGEWSYVIDHSTGAIFIAEGWGAPNMNLATYKRDTRAHIAKLQGELTVAEYRAEAAEKRERQIAAEKDIWKHRAQEAEARLKSTGRAP